MSLDELIRSTIRETIREELKTVLQEAKAEQSPHFEDSADDNKTADKVAGEWLTLKEAAAYASLDYARFTQAVKNGELPAYKVPWTSNNRGARIKKKDIDAWLEASPL